MKVLRLGCALPWLLAAGISREIGVLIYGPSHPLHYSRTG